MALARPPDAVALSRSALWPLDAGCYTPHPLHAGERAWPEANCYVDLWIEVLHVLGLDPMACLPFTLATDFEGDQWTFFKPPLGDLLGLYGIDVQELNIWASLPEHVLEQVSRGRLPIVEADAFFLPDTAGLSYRLEHTKTAIGIQEIDLERGRIGYFHNGGYFALEGEDYRGQFRLGVESPGLPPYVEFAKLGALRRAPVAERVSDSVGLLRGHLARRPAANPVRAYAGRLRAHTARLTAGSLAEFHRYAFATLRQMGACYELAAHYLRWLDGHGGPGVAAAAELDAIAEGAKALLFKMARSVSTRKPPDLATLDGLASHWDLAMEGLAREYGA
jgi:hypothetical protein